MNFNDEDIAAVETLGYTPDEAKFLYLVAVHSGYFVPRQFLAFSGSERGLSNNFVAKLESRGHATWREYDQIGGVYHLFSRTLYRYIGKENLRNRMRHSVEFIRTRLLLLDFILAHLSFDYFETEPEKVAYFCDSLGVPKKVLPARTYEGGPRTQPTLRYFVDKFPMFFDRARVPSSSVSSPLSLAPSSAPPPSPHSWPAVHLSYVDPGQPTLAGFASHLHAYLPLLRHLERAAFLYIGSSTVHFVSAERCFESLVRAPFEADVSMEVLRYFRLRDAWDHKRYSSLSAADVEWLKDASHRFGDRFDGFYHPWTAGALTEQALRAELIQMQPHRGITFQTCLVRPTRSGKKSSDEDSEGTLQPPVASPLP